MRIPRVMTSGIVITLKIGQSAGKGSKFAMQEYDSPSTTTGLLVLGVLANTNDRLKV